MADLDLSLDPYTLRAIAREQHERAIILRSMCVCDWHADLADDADVLAADLRTTAIQVEQARVRDQHAPANRQTDGGES